MKRISVLVLTLLGLAVVSGVIAGEQTVTVEGKVVCAKCSMGEKTEECQRVLVVDKDGETVRYYVAKNDVAEGIGSVCASAKYVKMTGALSEKGDDTWITPSEIEPVKET